MTLYLIQRKDGKYLRTKGYMGHGDCWVNNIDRAKIYTTLRAARSQTTWWTNHAPEVGYVDIIPLECTAGPPLEGERERIAKANETKERQRKNRVRKLKQKQIEKLQKQIDEL